MQVDSKTCLFFSSLSSVLILSAYFRAGYDFVLVRCVLNWFGDWSTGALYQVGKEFTSKLDLEKSNVSIGNKKSDRVVLKCPCDQKINSYNSLDFKTMLTKH